MRLTLIPPLCFALLTSGAPTAVASPDSTANRGLYRSFELPTYEYQPLPYTLQTAENWKTVGMNALIAQDYVNSPEAFDKAVDLSKGQNPAILVQRGWVHCLQGNYDDAIADLSQAGTLYQDQSQTIDFKNVREMQMFVEAAQSERFDSAS